MTIKLVALWGKPNDVEGFEKDYAATHWPLVARVPGLKGAIASKAIDGHYFRMAELVFENGDVLRSALASEEGLGLLADSGRFQEATGPTSTSWSSRSK